MLDVKDITIEDMENFRVRNKVRANEILTFLGKYQPFMEAIRTDVGQELMNDLILTAQEKLMLIANESASDADKAEYRVCVRRLKTWSERIALYARNLGLIKNGG